MKVFGSIKKLISLLFSKDGKVITVSPNSATYTADVTVSLPRNLAGNDTLVGEVTLGTLTNKSIDADNNTVYNIDDDEIKTGFNLITDVEQAGYDTASAHVTTDGSSHSKVNDNATNLTAHETESTGAHAASAIANTPAGNLVATDVQTALDELQSEIDPNTVHAAGDGSDHSDVADNTAASALNTTHRGLSDNPHSVTQAQVGLTDVDDTSDAAKPVSDATQTALNLKADLDGSTLVNTTLTLPHVNEAVDLTATSTDLNQLDGVTVGGASSGDIVDTATVQDIDGKTLKQFDYDHTVSSLSGTNAFLTPITAGHIFTNSGLVSIGAINSYGVQGYLILINRTGNTISLVNNYTSQISEQRILTGTGEDLEIADDTALSLFYDNDTLKWQVIGGSGSGAGGLEVEVKTASFTAESNKHYLIDTTSAEVVVTMPVIAGGEIIRFSDIGKTWGTNKAVLTPFSGDSIDENAADEVLNLDVDDAWIQVMGDVTASNWTSDEPSLVIGSQVVANADAIKRTKEVTLDITGYGDTTTLNDGVTLAKGIAYADSDDKWWLTFSIAGNLDVASANADISIIGIVFRSGATQAVATTMASAWGARGYAGGSTNVLGQRSSGGTNTAALWESSGDVSLESEPTWAAANLESNPAVGIERATTTSDGLIELSSDFAANDTDYGLLNPDASGTYTPTLSSGSNGFSGTASVFRYTKIQNIVTVSGQIRAYTTTAGGTTSITLDLPVPSSATVTVDRVSGHVTNSNALSTSTTVGSVTTANSSTTCSATWLSINNSPQYMSVTFMYELD